MNILILTDRELIVRLGIFVAVEVALRIVEVGVSPVERVARQLGSCAPEQTLQDLIDGGGGGSGSPSSLSVASVNFHYFLTCSSPHFSSFDLTGWLYKSAIVAWGCVC